MKRITMHLTGCLLSFLLLLGGVPALAAGETGEQIDPSLSAASDGHPGVSADGVGGFAPGETGKLEASTTFFLTIENPSAPPGGNPGGSGGPDSPGGGILRPLVPLKVIEELPVPLAALPNTGDGAPPVAALLAAALSGTAAYCLICGRKKKG